MFKIEANSRESVSTQMGTQLVFEGCVEQENGRKVSSILSTDEVHDLCSGLC